MPKNQGIYGYFTSKTKKKWFPFSVVLYCTLYITLFETNSSLISGCTNLWTRNDDGLCSQQGTTPNRKTGSEVVETCESSGSCETEGGQRMLKKSCSL